MRVIDKKFLDAFFLQRSEAIEVGIEDIGHIEKTIFDLCKPGKLFVKKKLKEENVFKLCNALNHYREVIHFSNRSINKDLMNSSREVLQELIDNNLEGNIKAIANFTIGLSYIPFVRGAPIGVYKTLRKGNGLITYFDSCKKAFRYFDDAAEAEVSVSTSFLEAPIRDECYGVWKQFSSDNHLSDLVFFYYLNSDLTFDQLMTLNDSYLEGVGESADVWKQK